jgi:hypothetical protein
VEEGLRRWGAFQRDAALIAGNRGLAVASAVTVVAGGSIGALVHWLAGVSWLLAALVALGSVFVFYTVGAFRVFDKADRRAQDAESALAEEKAALAEARAKQATTDQPVTFMGVSGGKVSDNTITNTYNAPQPVAGMPGGTLIDVGSGGFIGNEATIRYGGGPQAQLPAPAPSTPEERAGLRQQLFVLADQVETVMAPFGQSRQAVAAQMGIPADEFMPKMPEIFAERSRIDDAATERYNAECRSAVIQAYGHARSIGFADPELERSWHSQLGIVASKLPDHLRRIAAQMG